MLFINLKKFFLVQKTLILAKTIVSVKTYFLLENI